MCLEILMLWEDINEQQRQRVNTRLLTLGHTVEEVWDRVPELQPVKRAEKVEDIIEAEESGDGTIWEIGENETLDPGEVERLLRDFRQGQGTIEDLMSTDGEGWM